MLVSGSHGPGIYYLQLKNDTFHVCLHLETRTRNGHPPKKKKKKTLLFDECGVESNIGRVESRYMLNTTKKREGFGFRGWRWEIPMDKETGYYRQHQIGQFTRHVLAGECRASLSTSTS